MKLITAKTVADITLAGGVKVDVQKVDDNIEAVTVTDVEGKQLRIVKAGTYTDFVKILVEAPKQYKSQFKLSAKYNGMDVVYYADTKQEIEDKMNELYILPEDAIVEETQVEVVAKALNEDPDSIPF